MVASSVAFLVTLAAGACTAVGAAFVNVPTKYLTDKVFSAALGFSAGVMLYISFIEIFVKSYDEFVLAFHSGGEDEDPTEGTERNAYIAATGCLFGGMFVTWVLDVLVHKLHRAAGTEALGAHDIKAGDKLEAKPDSEGVSRVEDEGGNPEGKEAGLRERPSVPSEAGCDKIKEDEDVTVDSFGAVKVVIPPKSASDELSSVEAVSVGGSDGKDTMVTSLVGHSALMRMSLVTALAIALHNFPEGLATFISTKADADVGLSVAIAIGIHNIPEGLAVAMPLYTATGNKWKAFLVGALSGISEPIGAAIGWIAFSAKDPDSFAYAISFGAVGGMMVFITMFEILPVALKADPKNEVVAKAVVAGMGIMAMSLILFML